MKNFILALIILGLTSCAVYTEPVVVPNNVMYGTTTYCDEYDCRQVTGRYYYGAEGEVIYWDTRFGMWIGPHGYWNGGVYYRGFHPTYHSYYHLGPTPRYARPFHFIHPHRGR